MGWILDNINSLFYNSYVLLQKLYSLSIHTKVSEECIILSWAYFNILSLHTQIKFQGLPNKSTAEDR